MKRPLISAASFVLVSTVLSACGGGSTGTPAPDVIPASTLTVTVRDSVDSGAVWTYGAGTVTLRAFTGSTTVPGEGIASGTVDILGNGTVKLPGSPEGVLGKLNLSPKAFPVPWAELLGGCQSDVQESTPGTKALLLSWADYSNAQGGAELSLVTVEYSSGQLSALRLNQLVFVDRDDTLSGSLTCGAKVIPVALGLKRGWNVLGLDVDYQTKAVTLAVRAELKLALGIKQS